jgi:aspartate carbamoyltransferase catalytic subunit
MPEVLVKEIDEAGITQHATTDLDSVLGETDVLYVTRIQRERFEDPADYEAVKDAYVITPKTMTHARDKMALMHPLPRVGEIDPDVDEDPRAAYFRQMEYGMYVRMALLALVLGKA